MPGPTPAPAAALTLGTLPPAAAGLTPIFAPIFVEITSIVVLTGISPIDFNTDPQQQEAFAQAILGSLPSEHQDAEVTDIVARSARRRRLQAGSVEVEYPIVVRQAATAVTDGGARILSDVTSSLTAAVSSGEFLQALIEEAAAAGGSAAMAFMTIDVDVTASTAAIGDATLTLVFTTTPSRPDRSS